MPAPTHQKSFVLTVAESKRLIARALKRHPAIIRALNTGIVAIAKGTTNSYVVEELTSHGIDRPLYVTGHTVPSGGTSATIGNQLDDVVLREGQVWEGVSATEAVEEMGPGDIFIKGANALNYERGQAGILIGHPTGGTIGAAIGTVVSRRITLLLPVGLEKSVPVDLHEVYKEQSAAGPEGEGPMLWPVDGLIFTEVEAMETVMSGGRAAPIAAGGVAGAEGSVRISVWGTPEHLSRAEGAVRDVQGEPPFVGD